jgi:hypothetical protein
MTANDSTWDADWQKRIFIHLREKGYETINDFLRHFPAEPYVDVANRIAPWVAAMQLSRLQMQEAKHQGTIRGAAMDSIARNLNWRLPAGWAIDDKSVSEAAGAFANTSTSVVIDGQSAEFKSRIREIYQALKALQPPNGWRPIGANDPLIQEAFERGWPECVKPIMPVK